MLGFTHALTKKKQSFNCNTSMFLNDPVYKIVPHQLMKDMITINKFFNLTSESIDETREKQILGSFELFVTHLHKMMIIKGTTNFAVFLIMMFCRDYLFFPTTFLFACYFFRRVRLSNHASPQTTPNNETSIHYPSHPHIVISYSPINFLFNRIRDKIDDQP